MTEPTHEQKIAGVWARMMLEGRTPRFDGGRFKIAFNDMEPVVKRGPVAIEEKTTVQIYEFQRKIIGIWVHPRTREALLHIEVSCDGVIVMRYFRDTYHEDAVRYRVGDHF